VTDPPPRTLRVPASPDSLEAVHALVAALWADRPGTPGPVRLRFEIAVAEVAANIVEHAGAGRDGVTLSLRLTGGPDGVHADFEDDGGPAAVDLDDARVMAAEDAERGRGLPMTLASVDRLTYERRDGTNRWSLAVRC
jgi:serine/threonine-protein kinase RsbW